MIEISRTLTNYYNNLFSGTSLPQRFSGRPSPRLILVFKGCSCLAIVWWDCLKKIIEEQEKNMVS